MAEAWDGYSWPSSNIVPTLPVRYKVINLLTNVITECDTLLELELQFFDLMDTYEVSKMSSWTYKIYGNYRVETIPLEE